MVKHIRTICPSARSGTRGHEHDAPLPPAASLSGAAGTSARRPAKRGSSPQSSSWNRRGREKIHVQSHVQPQKQTAPAAMARAVSRCTTSTEAEGLEPPSGCPRRISSAVPYQLGLRLHRSVGTGGFEPPTPRSRSECSTGLSHVPSPGYRLYQPKDLHRSGPGGIRTHEGC